MRTTPPRFRFAPVPTQARHDGWTPARQQRFIEELATTRCISSACKAVGMSRESAYKLKERDDAVGFRSAWTKALRPVDDRPRRLVKRRALRLRGRAARPEVDNVEEVHGPPVSPDARTGMPSRLSALEPLLSALDPDRTARKASVN